MTEAFRCFHGRKMLRKELQYSFVLNAIKCFNFSLLMVYKKIIHALSNHFYIELNGNFVFSSVKLRQNYQTKTEISKPDGHT